MNYFVAFTARSGSNWLGELLRSTQALGACWEHFAFTATSLHDVRVFPNRTPSWDNSSWQGHYASYLRHTRSANGVTSCQITWGQWRYLCVGLGAAPPIDRWVWLRRRNILRQAISCYRKEVTNQWKLEPGDRPAPAPPFEPELILRHAVGLLDEETCWVDFFRRGIAAPLEVWYEDLCRDPLATIQAIASHVGVDVVSEPRSRLLRQADDISEEWHQRLLPTWQRFTGERCVRSQLCMEETVAQNP
ncbi:MAG: hypothetical protein JSS27_03305 [Planctomycetes bacterium]|nr:hypothetical protein [Planctomycetota bacterium]